MYSIIGADGKEYGPVAADQIRQWIALGRCDARTMARLDGSTDWLPLGQFSDFAQFFTSVAALPAAVTIGAPQTSGMAVASLICGLAGLVLCGVSAPIGLVLGFIARNQIKKSGGRLAGSGVALAGIITSSVTTAIFVLAVGAGLLLPAFAKARQKAQSIQCQNNLRQLSAAIRLYAGSHGGQLPPAATWCDAISNSVSSTNVFHCPAQRDPGCSYAYNLKLDGKNIGDVKPQTVLLFESDAGWNGAGGEDILVTRKHSFSRRNSTGGYDREDVFHVTFVDGSVAAIPASGLPSLRWEP